ncbi:hypothetical protein MKW94_024895 [Papaver nudicaule]|uniref:RING-type domain-containing protein n=1 Tax=Papaver nudicaule TaxID=74823 RepID=A0AA41W022_PAPNU|nr:hypothetical protein [Papaver nudicaule]
MIVGYPADSNTRCSINLNVEEVCTLVIGGDIESPPFSKFDSAKLELSYDSTAEEIKYKIQNKLHEFQVSDSDYVEGISERFVGTISSLTKPIVSVQSYLHATQLRETATPSVPVEIIDFVRISYREKFSDFEEDFDTEDEAYNGITRNPVSQSWIDRLERMRYRQGEDEACCCVCIEGVSAVDEVIKIPCSHILHSDCLVRWLQIDNSCPLCRCLVVKTEN